MTEENSKEEIELDFVARTYAIEGEKDTRAMQGRSTNFQKSSEMVTLKMMHKSEDDEDKKQENEGKYFDGITYVPIPHGVSEFDKGLLKSRVIKQLFLENKRAHAEISELKTEISKMGITRETTKVEEVVKPSIPTTLKMSDFVKARKLRKDENFRKCASEKKTSEESGQQGLTNRMHPDDTS